MMERERGERGREVVRSPPLKHPLPEIGSMCLPEEGGDGEAEGSLRELCYHTGEGDGGEGREDTGLLLPSPTG